MIESPLIQELKTQAQLQTSHFWIVKALEFRFGFVPPDLVSAVQLVSDVPRLEVLFSVAMDCPGIDAIRARLRS
jgi:hypothetical protein